MTGGEPLVLQRLDGRPFPAGAGDPPYPRPVRWAREYYYPLSPDQLKRPVRAKDLRVTTPALEARGRFYTVWEGDALRLERFVETVTTGF